VATEALYPAILEGAIPRFTCGGIYKPDITFFGEMLPEEQWSAAVRAMGEADLVLVLGTSLAVYPAAALPGHRAWNARLVVVNRDPTPLDAEAQLLVRGDFCAVLAAV